MAVEQAMDSSLATVILWGEDLLQLYNDAAIKVIGAGHPAAFGASADMLSGTDGYELAHLARSVLATGLPGRFESSGPDGGGNTWCAGALKTEYGEVAGVIFTIIARPLPRSEDGNGAVPEAGFRAFADNSDDALWVIDADSRTLRYLSPAYERIWGESRTVVLHDIERWAQLVHPDDLAAAREGVPRLLQGETSQQQYRIVRPDTGAIRWIQDRGFPIRDGEGAVVQLAGIASDITEQVEAQQLLRSSERRHRSLLQGIPQLVWRSGDGGDWTWSSLQWQAFTGQSLEQSLGLGWIDAVHPADRPRVMAAWAEAPAKGALDVDARLLHAPSGLYRWFQTRAQPVRDDVSGDILEWLGTCTDIDDLRTAQERQRLLLGELQHRVRNILAVIRSIARRTADGSKSVADFAAHLEGRINALARAQAVVTRDPLAGVKLETLVAEELAAFGARESEAGARGAALRIEGPDVRLLPKAAEMFALAVHELATNAVKHGVLAPAARDGRLLITWRIGDPKTPQLVFMWRETLSLTRRRGLKKRGFGREFIEQTLRYELDAASTLTMDDAGLQCEIRVPLTDRVWIGPAR
jgi:PAS domain S-box-containing protein